MAAKNKKVVIESISGAGKSTAALEAASILSENYPGSDIKVADSTGVHSFRGGEKVGHRWPWLDALKPQAGQRGSKVRLLGFTALRRGEEGMGQNADLLIGVRDPFRIEPAAYSVIYGPGFIKNLSPEQRLRLFNSMTFSAHPEAVVHLETTPERAALNFNGREGLVTDETEENMHLLADELPLVLAGYKRLYDRPVIPVEALTPATSSEVAEQIEQFLPQNGRGIVVPKAPPVISH